MGLITQDLAGSGDKLENRRRHRSTNNVENSETDSDGLELYVFSDSDDFVRVVDSQRVDSTALAANVWLVFAGSEEDLVQMEEVLINHLTLESMLFVHYENKVEEWYAIGGGAGGLIKQEFARFGRGGEMTLSRADYIWDRRADLRGFVFR